MINESTKQGPVERKKEIFTNNKTVPFDLEL